MSEFPAIKCLDCGSIYGHPLVLCRKCRSDSLKKYLIEGEGSIYASTVIRVPDTDYIGEEPYEVCIVDVGKSESVRVTARMERLADLSPGDEVEFVEKRNGIFYFQPL